jgi:hypothetical protein
MQSHASSHLPLDGESDVALLGVRGSTTGKSPPECRLGPRRVVERTLSGRSRPAITPPRDVRVLGRSRPIKLIDRSEVLVGEVFACGREALKDRVQQRHRGSRALLNLAYEL